MSEVNVYLVHLDSARLPHDALRDWLDSEERTRCAAYGREILRRRFVAAHAALRLVLGRVLGRHPAEIIFRRNAWGRPEMPEGPAFNLSHAGPQALIAVSAQQAIGVDVELRERKMSREVYDAVTSAAEHRDTADAGDRLRLWVRKEAVLKALGLGLSFAPQAVTVGGHATDYKCWKSILIAEAGKLREFSLVDLALPHRLYGALAIHGAPKPGLTLNVQPLVI